MRLLIQAAALLASASAFAAEPAASSAHPPGHQMERASDKSPKAMDHADHCGLPMGDGVLTAIDVAKARATIDHKPIEALGWDAMTMAFAVEKTVDLSAFAAGDRVHFLLKDASSKKGKSYSVAAMCATEAAKETHEACMAAMHKAAMKITSDAGKPCAMDGMDHGAMDHGPKSKEDAPASGDHSQH